MENKNIDLDTRLRRIIDVVNAKCSSMISLDGVHGAVLIDPVENVPIRAHYAMTHYAAAALLLSDDISHERGIAVLDNLIANWDEDKELAGYHHDFNNFAMCLIEEQLVARGDQKRAAAVRDIVLRTPDSGGRVPWHNTVNWLPMRIFVNKCRFRWTGCRKFERRVRVCEILIDSARYKDGFIDDLMPKGKSFNLQYSIATTALLQFLCDQKVGSYPVQDSLTGLMQAIGPDGDCNYIGRGTNQLFAWGLWLYLLKANGQLNSFSAALTYIERHLSEAIDQNNLLLNDCPGEEKHFWMDYHYSSVYYSHLLLWLVLSSQLPWIKKDEIELMPSFAGDSGLRFERGRLYYVSLFEGRSAYLAERGPVVEQVWLKKYGTIVKSAFGPSPDHFGASYSSSASNHNCFSVLSWNEAVSMYCCAFPKVDVSCVGDRLRFEFDCGTCILGLINLPLLERDSIGSIKAYAGGEEVPLRLVFETRNAYGAISVFQSIPRYVRFWSVEICLGD